MSDRDLHSNNEEKLEKNEFIKNKDIKTGRQKEDKELFSDSNMLPGKSEKGDGFVTPPRQDQEKPDSGIEVKTLPDAPRSYQSEEPKKGIASGRILRVLLRVILPIAIVLGVLFYFFWPRDIVQIAGADNDIVLFTMKVQQFEKEFNKNIQKSGTGFTLLALDDTLKNPYNEDYAATPYEGMQHYDIPLEGDIVVRLAVTEKGYLYEVSFSTETMGQETGAALREYTFAAFDVLVRGSEDMNTETPERDMISLHNGDFSAGSLNEEYMTVQKMYYIPVDHDANAAMALHYYINTASEGPDYSEKDIILVEYYLYAFQ